MPNTFGYMLTWTTYGSWLQGDERGYVRDGRILCGDKEPVTLCENLQKDHTVKLRHNEKDIVCRAGRVWTRGFDKRFCFDQQDLVRRIQYVNNHNH